MSRHGFRIAAVAFVLVGLGLLAAVAQAFSPVGQPGHPGFALPAKDAQMLAAVESCFPGDQERDQNQANDQTRDNLQDRDRDRDQDCLPGDCLPEVDLDRDRVRLQARDQQQDLSCGSDPPETSQARVRAQAQERVVYDQGPKQDATDPKRARSQEPLHEQTQKQTQKQTQEQNRVTTETQAEVREQVRSEPQAQVGEPAGNGKR